jgi:calcineurin-like phosphoesterase family protein
MKIVLNQGQNLYFTSDTHYNHSNICSSTTRWDRSLNKTRDFRSLDHMNDTLVNNINELVGQDDILIHLGDWSFGGFERIEEFRNRIVCRNIHLVLGNHDQHIRNNKGNVQTLFLSALDYMNLDLRINRSGNIEKYNLILMHYPISSWDGLSKGNIHLHGHVHLPSQQRIAEGRAMDVGVDGNNYYPISINEIIHIMDNRPIKRLSLPIDHHEQI